MNKTVADVMTTALVTLNEEDSISALEPGMKAFGLRHLPVVDGDRLVGLLSHRDVLRLSLSPLVRNALHEGIEQQKQAETFVASVMQRDLRTVRPDTTVSVAAKILVDHKIGCLPVVEDDDRLVGIVTEADLLRDLIGEG